MFFVRFCACCVFLCFGFCCLQLFVVFRFLFLRRVFKCIFEVVFLYILKLEFCFERLVLVSWFTVFSTVLGVFCSNVACVRSYVSIFSVWKLFRYLELQRKPGDRRTIIQR